VVENPAHLSSMDLRSALSGGSSGLPEEINGVEWVEHTVRRVEAGQMTLKCLGLNFLP
jgi:hypothetical protein